MSLKKIFIIISSIVIAAIITISIIIFVIGSLLTNLLNGMLGNDIKKEEVSPDGRYTAFAFIRDGGGTTSFSPQVSILKKGKELKNESGNVFVGDHSDYIDIKWEDSNTLIIYHNVSGSDIIKQEYKKYGVEIKYNEK